MPSIKCRHLTRGLLGEFNESDGCLDCGKIIIKKPKKRKQRVTYPLPKCYISTRSGQYKRLEKDSKTLKLIIKHQMDILCWPDVIRVVPSMLRWEAAFGGGKCPWIRANSIYTAVRRAAKMEKK